MKEDGEIRERKRENLTCDHMQTSPLELIVVIAMQLPFFHRSKQCTLEMRRDKIRTALLV